MKIFNVILHEGSYSDQCWNLMGSFSTEELAQKCIDNLCTPPPIPPDEELLAKYDEYKVEIERRNSEFEKEHEEKRVQFLKQRTALFNKSLALPEGSPERNKMAIRANECGRKFLSQMCEKYTIISFETWLRCQMLGRSKCERSDLSIQETKLDKFPA